MAVDWDEMVLGPLMAEFGEDTQPVYTPAGGVSFPIDGIFDEAFTEVVLLDDGSRVASTFPVLGVRIAQIPNGPRQGDRVSIAKVNTTYVVREVRPDGHGEAKLLLNFVSSP